MKVDIKHVEKKQGMVFKKVFHGVQLTVIFSEEEKAIIKERKLERELVAERGLSAEKDEWKENNRGIASKLVTAAVKGIDANSPNLTIGKLLKGPDTYYFDTITEAKDYDNLLRDTLPQMKNYIMDNAEVEEKETSFEI